MKTNPTLPNAMVIRIVGLTESESQAMANYASGEAKRLAPKLSGQGAASIQPLWGDGWFGLSWAADQIWYQEAGIRAFTMNRLQGKVIPMWIDDPRGEEAKKNPKAKKRTTASGKKQVLIFRRVARKGQRKMVRRKVGKQMRNVSVPMSYPGAPGRIARREASAPFTTAGRVGGQIAKGNIGVRWRHPGLEGRGFMREALYRSCFAFSKPRAAVAVGRVDREAA